MRFERVLFTGAAALCVAAGSLRAATIASFEDGLDGFAPADGTVTLTQGTVGATDGTHSLKVVRATGNWDNTMSANLDLSQVNVPNN